VKVLAGIASQTDAPHSSRVAAATALLDRGWGRPKQEMSIEHKRTLGELSDAELEAIARGEPDSSTGIAAQANGSGQPDSVH